MILGDIDKKWLLQPINIISEASTNRICIQIMSVIAKNKRYNMLKLMLNFQFMFKTVIYIPFIDHA